MTCFSASEQERDETEQYFVDEREGIGNKHVQQKERAGQGCELPQAQPRQDQLEQSAHFLFGSIRQWAIMRVTKVRLKPPSDEPASQDGEPSLPGGRSAAAAKTASKARHRKLASLVTTPALEDVQGGQST